MEKAVFHHCPQRQPTVLPILQHTSDMATACKARPFGLNLRQCTSSLSIRTTAAPRCRGLSPLSKRPYSTSDSLPKIADTSVWTSMVPKFIRNLGSRKERKPSVSNEWNPATFYIIIFTLIGSQAIRMIALKNSYANYRRSTDAKIELLREVIERVKRGEKVDVEKLLGTGDEAKEREWEEGTLRPFANPDLVGLSFATN